MNYFFEIIEKMWYFSEDMTVSEMEIAITPEASKKLWRLVVQMDFHRYSIEMEIYYHTTDKPFLKNVKDMYIRMFKHLYPYMKHLKAEVSDYWHIVMYAMRRDARDCWEEILRSSSDAVETHLNDKIRKRLKKKTSGKPSLRSELERWINFNHFLDIYLSNDKCDFNSGMYLLKSFIYSFTDLRFIRSAEIRDSRTLIEREQYFAKLAKVAGRKERFMETMIWRHYKRKVMEAYKIMCSTHIHLKLVPKIEPSLSNRSTSMVYHVMKKIVGF